MKKKPINQTEKVNVWMEALDHPLKEEMEAVRQIIKSMHLDFIEDIKWAAPSFLYKTDMATFNHRTHKYVHLIFHNGAILGDESGYLEGDYVDRRMVYFHNMDEVKAKEPAVRKAIQRWIEIYDAE